MQRKSYNGSQTMSFFTRRETNFEIINNSLMIFLNIFWLVIVCILIVIKLYKNKKYIAIGTNSDTIYSIAVILNCIKILAYK